jgi:hypothetical protein
MRKSIIFCLAIIGAFALHQGDTAYAATFSVTNTSDSGAGSLRKAYEEVSGEHHPDRIHKWIIL